MRSRSRSERRLAGFRSTGDSGRTRLCHGDDAFRRRFDHSGRLASNAHAVVVDSRGEPRPADDYGLVGHDCAGNDVIDGRVPVAVRFGRFELDWRIRVEPWEQLDRSALHRARQSERRAVGRASARHALFHHDSAKRGRARIRGDHLNPVALRGSKHLDASLTVPPADTRSDWVTSFSDGSNDRVIASLVFF